MCKHGDTEHVRVRSGAGWKQVSIDACIAGLVRALQIGGVDTRVSCCGHGRMCGDICLGDGRVLLIVPTSESVSTPNDAFFADHGIPWLLGEARRRARLFGKCVASFEGGTARKKKP